MEYRADFLLGLIGFILVQLFTNFGKLLNNIFIHLITVYAEGQLYGYR